MLPSVTWRTIVSMYQRKQRHLRPTIDLEYLCCEYPLCAWLALQGTLVVAALLIKLLYYPLAVNS